ncbi:MAG TPA: aminodeoxychorismate synthase component I [Pyrinomonadaceae bacterium]|nr:aminodeoxychorismate synthase component I [Pyrinomonadaceae bacterium]
MTESSTSSRPKNAEYSAILDSCGLTRVGSHLTIAAKSPVSIHRIASSQANDILRCLDESLAGDRPCIFTLSYDAGIGLNGIFSQSIDENEPGLFLASYSNVEVGNKSRVQASSREHGTSMRSVSSIFKRDEYLSSIEIIKEQIRSGITYQTNLTQQLSVQLDADFSSLRAFERLRSNHPAPFLAFIDRGDSTVISASPELFFRIEGDRIVTSPIKGTRPRGSNNDDDERLRNELATSKKDRAENTMIVDLLRNDLGRVCEFGSVVVDELCAIEQYPSLFHMVSTVRGKLRDDASISDIFRALFPCGSITGAPKISTMRVIDELEPTPRGLSMGCIGLYLPPGIVSDERIIETSVAIRTAVIRGNVATFNVGGGIVIDSDPELEYAETLTKATALLDALGADIRTLN